MGLLSEADHDELKTMFARQLDYRVRLRVLTRPTSRLYIPGQQLCASSCEEAEPFARELASPRTSWRSACTTSRRSGAREVRRLVVAIDKDHTYRGSSTTASETKGESTRPLGLTCQVPRGTIGVSGAMKPGPSSGDCNHPNRSDGEDEWPQRVAGRMRVAIQCDENHDRAVQQQHQSNGQYDLLDSYSDHDATHLRGQFCPKPP